MRILAYEHFTVTAPGATADLCTEGGAILAALAIDLARAGHDVSTIIGSPSDFLWSDALRRAGVRVETIRRSSDGDVGRLLEEGLDGVEAVWIVAPETRGCLESLTRAALSAGARVLGSTPAAVALAESKLRTARRLRAAGIRVVPTVAIDEDLLVVDRTGWEDPSRWTYPLVVKPDDGVGCAGVGLARSPDDLGDAISRARLHASRVVVQPCVRGRPASVSLLAHGGGAVPLALQSQHVRIETGARGVRRPAANIRYTGGEVPLESRWSGAALALARRACEAVPGLAGFVGVDLVLTRSGPVVIEVNPRLTTAYLGLRAAADVNVADLAVRACEGQLPEPLRLRRRVRFTTGGLTNEVRGRSKPEVRSRTIRVSPHGAQRAAHR